MKSRRTVVDFGTLETNEKLDKDRFRRDLGGVTEAYAEVAQGAWGSLKRIRRALKS